MNNLNIIKKYNSIIRKNLQNLGKDTELYVNYPFCANRCKYCIYHIAKYTQRDSNLFLKYYNKEIDLYVKYLKNFKFQEIHIGGGTPNLTSPKFLIEPLKKIVNFKKIKHFVVEIYPRHDLKKYLDDLKKYNVTKIILGVQALNDEVLKNENRFVTVKTIIDNFKILSKSNLTWSVDLIYGLNSRGMEQNYLAELKTILQYRPHGLHLYNIRGQQENSYYFKKKEESSKKTRIKFMDTFNFSDISTVLKERGYELVGDEWCLTSSKQNKKYAQRDARYYGEQETLGLGLWARSRNRRIKYRNEKKLQNYIKLLDKNLFPIEKFFDYKDKYFLVANILLSLNQSSQFDLKEIFSIPNVSMREKKEVSLFIFYLRNKGVNFDVVDSKFILPRHQYTKGISLSEKYLKEKSGYEYFYKN